MSRLRIFESRVAVDGGNYCRANQGRVTGSPATPGRVLACNAKSKVVLQPGAACVVKSYHTADAVGRIEQDQWSLTRLSEEVPPLAIRGWQVHTVRLLWVALDRRSFGMEHVPGALLADLDGAALERAEFLYGAWLAHFHRHMHHGETRGPLYTDLSLHNVILDEAARRLVILDPGNQFGRHGLVYEDLIQHIHSLAVTCVRRLRSPLPFLRGFLAGYRTGKHAFSLGAYAVGLAHAHYRAAGGLARSRPARLPAFLATVVAMAPVYLAYVPAMLMRPHAGERGRASA